MSEATRSYYGLLYIICFVVSASYGIYIKRNIGMEYIINTCISYNVMNHCTDIMRVLYNTITVQDNSSIGFFIIIQTIINPEI